MSVLGNIKSRCISLLGLLKRLGQNLVKPLRKRKHMTSTKGMTEKHGEEEKLLNARQCLSEKTLALGTIQRRTISCPSMSLLYAQTAPGGDGIAQEKVLDPKSATILRISGNQETGTNGKKLDMNSEGGAGVKRLEEGAVTPNCQSVKRKISNALTIGITGAKIASLFFTISSILYQTNSDPDIIEEEIDA